MDLDLIARDRREFLRAAIVAGAGAWLSSSRVLAQQAGVAGRLLGVLPLGGPIAPPPFGTLLGPEMPTIKVLVCIPTLPIRIVFASAATPTLPISMLLLPVVRV